MEQTQVKKGGRPKLKPGEKGQYNVSRKQQAKLRVQKKETKARRKKSEATVKKIKQTIAKPSGSKIIEQETLDAAPKAVRDLVEDTSEIIFKPNDGPQTDFLASPERDVFYGGAAGGGKSYALIADLLRYCDNPNHRALVIRRTLDELTELINKSREFYPKAFPGAVFREAKSMWQFPSGATAWFSYLDKDKDVSRYQGQSFTWIGIDEITHYPTPYVWEYLRSRLRTTDPS
ncbi:uncharacterized protein METZ01_LOCUS297398, partial [marine metagenome]